MTQLPKPSPSLSKGVFVNDDLLLDDFVGGEVVIFNLKPAVKPPGKVAQRLGHDLFGVLGWRLPCRAVACDVHGHGVFVIVAAPVAGFGAELIEVPPPDSLQPVGDAVQGRVLWSVVADAFLAEACAGSSDLQFGSIASMDYPPCCGVS